MKVCAYFYLNGPVALGPAPMKIRRSCEGMHMPIHAWGDHSPEASCRIRHWRC